MRRTIDRVVFDVPRNIADEATKVADKIERGGPPDEDPARMTAKIEDPDAAP
jgi:hypothetical protein